VSQSSNPIGIPVGIVLGLLALIAGAVFKRKEFLGRFIR
jgi:hypothetical protein